MSRFLVLIAGVLWLVACQSKLPADMIVMGRIWTGDSTHRWAEAMAISGDTILAIGTAADMAKYKGEQTKLVTAPDQGLVTPGFIDTHTHFVEGGFRLASVQLRDAPTRDEFIQRIKRYAASLEPGVWVLGGDWDHENWGGELPTRQWIDSVTADRPVWINRLDGHMSLANSAALRAAGIADDVKDVEGGSIVRSRGKLTGIFKDNAQTYIDRAVPMPTEAQEDRALEEAMAYVTSKGVTSVHNVSGNEKVFERAHDAGRLQVRVYAGRSIDQWRELAAQVSSKGRGDRWLRIGSLKAFVDGSLGSHTASFFEPYADAPSDSGFLVVEPAELLRLVAAADSAHLQLAVHAIGDKAIHTLLNIFEAVERSNGARDRRFRIEHAQHIAPADIPRFNQLKVIASVQPYHAIDDGRWAEKVIGPERSQTTYAFKSLLDAGAKVAFGSDWFVAPPTPLEGIYAAVTRRTLDGKNPEGWMPHQKITVEQALTAYTLTAAYASFEEGSKGSLEPGKLADFVILDRDITRIAPVEINNTNVLSTVVGGKVVYEKK